MATYKPVMEDLENELNIMTIRYWISKKIKNYDDKKVYIIYDGKDVEEYSLEMHQFKRELKSFKNYLIVRTLKVK